MPPDSTPEQSVLQDRQDSLERQEEPKERLEGLRLRARQALDRIEQDEDQRKLLNGWSVGEARDTET